MLGRKTNNFFKSRPLSSGNKTEPLITSAENRLLDTFLKQNENMSEGAYEDIYEMVFNQSPSSEKKMKTKF